MLAKASRELPSGDFLYEPKWDGFRCIVFKDGDEIELGSRNQKPFTRYFPELLGPLREQLPARCVIDGELVVPTATGLDFDLLGQRIHPADSRVQKLAVETPASFVAFDILCLGDDDLRQRPFGERRAILAEALAGLTAPLHVTPSSSDPVIAQDWFERFEGSGFDGVMAKAVDGTYVEDKRVQLKVKHHRTADCVVAGFRYHKEDGVGSLLLGLYDSTDVATQQLHHVGVCSAFAASRRRTLVGELAPYEEGAAIGHPWISPALEQTSESTVRMPGAQSRWSAGKESDWVPLRCELVAEVTYENFTAGRFRHPARFVRWRPDKSPNECTYDQVDQPPPLEFTQIFDEVTGS